MDFIEYDALMDVDSNYNAAARELKYTSFYWLNYNFDFSPISELPHAL